MDMRAINKHSFKVGDKVERWIKTGYDFYHKCDEMELIGGTVAAVEIESVCVDWEKRSGLNQKWAHYTDLQPRTWLIPEEEFVKLNPINMIQIQHTNDEIRVTFYRQTIAHVWNPSPDSVDRLADVINRMLQKNKIKVVQLNMKLLWEPSTETFWEVTSR